MKCILIYEIKVCLINNINIKTGLKKYKHDFRFLNNYWLTLQFCNWVDHIKLTLNCTNMTNFI